jgi:hypothetical protein
MTAPPEPLQPLVTKLKACPTRDDRVTAKRLLASWARFQTLAPEDGDTITPALLVGVILYDPETFAPLLTGAEHAQLAALGQVAFERYQQLTHPPDKLGKTLVADLKETL